MSSEKDILLAAALMENSSQAFRSAMNSAVDAAATEARTAALANSMAKLANARHANLIAEQDLRTARLNASMKLSDCRIWSRRTAASE